jgi:hypothetical protein
MYRWSRCRLAFETRQNGCWHARSATNHRAPDTLDAGRWIFTGRRAGTRPRVDQLAIAGDTGYCAAPEVGAGGAFETSMAAGTIAAGTMTYFTTKRAE